MKIISRNKAPHPPGGVQAHLHTPLPVRHTLYTHGVSHRERYGYKSTPPCKIHTVQARHGEFAKALNILISEALGY
jgi:hypothetical protein